MKEQLIISVGREFGSGGHEIAKILSEHYKIDLLDHNLLDEIAVERGLDADTLRHLDEKHIAPFVSRSVRNFSVSPEKNIAQLQFDYIEKKAAKGDSFVIVGRCSEQVLKAYDSMVSVFVLGEKHHKIQRICELFKLIRLTIKLIHQLNKIQKNHLYLKRKRYHNGHYEGKWGDSRNYDISVNSSVLGIEGTVAVLIDFIDRKRQL